MYIAEGLQRTIMVFSPQGKYIRSIGRVGRGPGEFPTGPKFNFTNKEEIVALDLELQRLTWFSKEGEILSEYTPPVSGVVWTEKFFQAANGDNIMLKKPRRIGLDDPENYRKYVFHRYSNSFEDHIDSFGKFEELSPEANSEFVELINTRMSSGHFVKTGEGGFLYAPAMYNGKIYKFENSDNKWIIVDTFEGHIHWEEAVEPDAEGSMSMLFQYFDGTGEEQRGSGIINSYSIGLIEMSDGKVLHFSGQRMVDQDSIQTMIEVFNPDGDLIGTGPFDEINIHINLSFLRDIILLYGWTKKTGSILLIIKRIGR
nr:6-bladed beta-propeller [Gracilimonas mengyeensis]